MQELQSGCRVLGTGVLLRCLCTKACMQPHNKCIAYPLDTLDDSSRYCPAACLHMDVQVPSSTICWYVIEQCREFLEPYTKA